VNRFTVALAALATLITGAIGTAKAVELGVGPEGVYVGPDRDRYYHDRDYNADTGRCRVVIKHRTNRMGEDVEVRKRICD
jgi:hypothetical protein